MPKSGVYRKRQIDLLSELHAALKAKLSGELGAIMIFLGVAREEGRSGKKVHKLVMESYEEHANKAIARICSEVKRKSKVSFVLIYHLLEEFRPGEPVVLVIVGGARRKDVFSAMEEAVRRYKTEPALFKKEVYVNGTHKWIH
ncbi:MAG: hypothetical protein FJ358_05940 [Thaumarchaeota archaeon]|nr:hypothetical protein [Nitrososphaerota archaeon]